MEALGLVSILSLLASAAAIGLAVAAFIFSWASHSRSSDMQMKAQESLAKISEKAEVIVKQTSDQMDKAWDYVTRPVMQRTPEEIEESEKRQEEQRKAIVDEATQKALEEIKSVGVLPEQIEQIEKKLETIIAESTEETAESEYDARVRQIDRKFRAILQEINILADANKVALCNTKTARPQDVTLKWLAEALGDRQMARRIHHVFNLLGETKTAGYSSGDFHAALFELDRAYRLVRRKFIEFS